MFLPAIASVAFLLSPSQAVRPEKGFSLKAESMKEIALAESAKSSAKSDPDCGVHGCLTLELLEEPEHPSEGGYCMDGTQFGYHYGAPPHGTSDLLVIFMKGGGGCQTLGSCESWGVGDGKGTSGYRNFEVDLAVPHQDRWQDKKTATGKLSIDQESNPYFYDAHHIYYNYCTGDSHAGQLWNPDDEIHGGKYFVGHLNFKRFVAHLKTLSWARDVRKVLLYGNSAGGNGVFTNCDYLSGELSGLPAGAVKCAPESGLFLQAMWQGRDGDAVDEYRAPQDFPSWQANVPWPPSETPPPEECQNWENHDVSVPQTCGGSKWQRYWISPQCRAAHPDNPEACFNAGARYRHIETPLFVKQDEFDTSPLAGMGFDSCIDKQTEEGRDYLRRFGASVRATLEWHKEGDGVYLTSCYQHGGHNATVNGGSLSYEQSLGKWFNGWGRPELYRRMDTCTTTQQSDGLPCNPGCANLDEDCCQNAFVDGCVDALGSMTECLNCQQSILRRLLNKGCVESELPAMCEEFVR